MRTKPPKTGVVPVKSSGGQGEKLTVKMHFSKCANLNVCLYSFCKAHRADSIATSPSCTKEKKKKSACVQMQSLTLHPPAL